LLQTLLGSVAERGTTVFLSSHIVSELEPVCDGLIILSAARVQTSGSIDDLLADHRILVGPRSENAPTGVTLVSSSETSRQSTFLVRGDPPDLGPDWQVLEPTLDEIVLGYLANPTVGGGMSGVTSAPGPGTAAGSEADS
jgi:ABC-2 type transport system ATP-binding protein